MKKKVVLIEGGMGAEREVSLSTGQAFKKALDELGYPYEVIDAKEDLPVQLFHCKADVALLALHGKYAEDGVVQSLCEYVKLPYTGSGVLASSVCMDKAFSKQIYESNAIPTPKYEIYDLRKLPAHLITRTLPFPLVVKPSREGSSVGVSLVYTDEEYLSAIEKAAVYDHFVLVEEYISGLEITVPVLEGKALTSIEIVPKVDFYTYENKYTAGKTDYFLPARVSKDVEERCQKIAVQVCEVCRVRSYARVDFRVTQEGAPFVIEVNTLPGCTPTSLVPKAAAYEGINFAQFIDRLIHSAGLDYQGVR